METLPTVRHVKRSAALVCDPAFGVSHRCGTAFSEPYCCQLVGSEGRDSKLTTRNTTLSRTGDRLQDLTGIHERSTYIHKERELRSTLAPADEQLPTQVNTMASLQIPSRGKSGGTKSTKAVILVGGPSRGTRFRPLSLDLPKVYIQLHQDTTKPPNG